MSLCIPFNVIETVIGKLAAQSWLVYQKSAHSRDQRKRVGNTLDRATVDARVLLATTQMTVRDLMNQQGVCRLVPHGYDAGLAVRAGHRDRAAKCLDGLIELNDRDLDLSILFEVSGNTECGPWCAPGASPERWF